jgi:hypothetical protein
MPEAGTPSYGRCYPGNMDDEFIERTLKERRSLQEALADFLAKYDRIPLGNERSAMGRMIEALKAEIALRKATPRTAK